MSDPYRCGRTLETPMRAPLPLTLCLLILATLLGLAPHTAEAAPVRSGFDPRHHGFEFANTFNNDVIKEIDFRTGGLCGGMSYAAIDYFHHRMNKPVQDYRPANQTPLQRYIFARQLASLTPNIANWARYKVNPDGMHNRTFFRSTVSGNPNSELGRLRQRVRLRAPAVLDLVSYGGKIGKAKRPGDHQVVCTGYDLGRFDERRGTHVGDIKLFIYDPNFPNEEMTLVPDPSDNSWYYTGTAPHLQVDGQWIERWRTWFVDTHYQPKRPPVIQPPRAGNPAQIQELVVQVDTGKDDLRGGKDNVDLVLHLTDGSTVVRPAINLRARWLSNYTEFARVFLPRPIARDQIREVELRTTFRGGISGDNWNADRIVVYRYEGTRRRVLAERNAFFRFTGRRNSVRIPVRGTRAPSARPGQVTHLHLDIRTGGDDLRGQNSNVDAIIVYRDGRRQTVRTLNKRRSWNNGSEHSPRVDLERPVNRGDIVAIELRGTMRGGIGGDNWNLDGLKVRPFAGRDELPAYYERGGRPLHRFTGRNRSFTARW